MKIDGLNKRHSLEQHKYISQQQKFAITRSRGLPGMLGPLILGASAMKLRDSFWFVPYTVASVLHTIVIETITGASVMTTRNE